MTLVVCVILVLSITAPAVAQEQTPTSDQNSAIEDGEIVQCGMITEDGNYEVASTFEHDGSSVCLNVTAETVTIEGGTLQGDRDSSTAIQANGGYGGQITIRDVRFEHWGETALHSNWNGQPFVVQNSEFVTNTHVLRGTEGGGFEMYDSEVINTYSTAIYGQRMGTVIIHDSTFTDGGGPAFSTIDGADVEIRGSEFTNHGTTPLVFQHSTRAEIHNTDISDNAGNGMSVQTTGHTVEVEVHDSTITNNDEHGVNAHPFRGYEPVLTLDDTEIDDNGGLAINSLKGDEVENDPGISASNLDLGGGLIVDFDELMLDLSTEAADDHDTDALVFEGPADADISGTFTTGGDESTLWAQVNDGWQERASYDSGSFTQVIGPGTWTASAGPQDTSTPEPTDTPQNTDTPEQTDTSTPRSDSGDSTSTPSGPVSGGFEPSTDTPEPRDSPEPTGSNGGEIRVTQTAAGESESRSTPTDATSTSDSENSDTDTDLTGEEQTGTETNQGEDSDSQETESDDGLSMDGPGFGALAALIAVFGSTLLIRRRS